MNRLDFFKIILNFSNFTKIFFLFMPIADYQVFIALFLALATGIFAVRLGVALYK
jgi:photosystem I reaction center subunit XII